MLKEMFPIEAGDINPENRIIPHLPGEEQGGPSWIPSPALSSLRMEAKGSTLVYKAVQTRPILPASLTSSATTLFSLVHSAPIIPEYSRPAPAPGPLHLLFPFFPIFVNSTSSLFLLLQDFAGMSGWLSG